MSERTYAVYVVGQWFRSRRGRYANQWRFQAYIGHWFTKRDAMRDHAKAFGQTWEERFAKGDRVTIAYLDVQIPERPRD